MRSKSHTIKGVLAAVVATGALAGATAASAEIACNAVGDCWHVHRHYDNYPADAGVVFHDDGWRATHWDNSMHWRGDHDGRGYYRSGVWIGF